jgi:carbon starvation protein
MNVKGDPVATVEKITSLGFPVTVAEMDGLARSVGEKSLFGRTGGAATLAVGMARIFSSVLGSRWIDLWYHFAIMFEALFILTTLDAGTRVGRYLVQDALGRLWKPLGDTRSLNANLLASVLVVAGWGYFLIQGVRDPLGGINSLWPLFGIANQLLASIALCLATTVILKMQLAPRNRGVTGTSPAGKRPRPVFAMVTLLPLAWLLSVTLTAGWQKIFHEEARPGFPRLGFLQIARELDEKLPALQAALGAAETAGNVAGAAAAGAGIRANRAQAFNNRLDALVAGFFLLLVGAIVLLSVREWILLLARRRAAHLHETDPVWLPDYAVAEGGPARALGLFALVLALARELSGETCLERAQNGAGLCACDQAGPAHPACPPAINLAGPGRTRAVEKSRAQHYVETVERRFQGVNRCC